MFRSYLLAFALIVTTLSYSQTTINGDIRVRPEFRNGFRTLPPDGSQPAFFVSQRSRLVLGHQQNKVTYRLSFQDVRVWGDEVQTASVPGIALHEAWVDFPLSQNFALKLGRQEIAYDDHRLLGNLDWAMQGRKHDAALLKYKRGNWHMHMGGAYNQNAELLFQAPYPLNNYRTLGLLRLERQTQNLRFNIMGITDGYHATDADRAMMYRYTVGPFVSYSRQTGGDNPHDILLKFSTYGQLGNDAQRNSIEAGMLNLLAIMSFNTQNGIMKRNVGELAVGLDYLTGTTANARGMGKTNAFHTLYPTNHRHYGHLDYFLNIPPDTRQYGLVNPYISGKMKLNDTLSVGLDLHYFLTEQTPIRGMQELPRGLGAEADFYLDFNYSRDITIRGGISAMLPTETMAFLKDGNHNTVPVWGWMMFVFRPRFL